MSLDVWAENWYLHVSEGLSGKAIAARLGVAHKTVAKALAADGPPLYSRYPPDRRGIDNEGRDAGEAEEVGPGVP